MKELTAGETGAEQKFLTIFRSIAAADMNAVRECLDRHGNLVSAAAKYNPLDRRSEKGARGNFSRFAQWQSRRNEHNQQDIAGRFSKAFGRLQKRVKGEFL